MRTRTKFLAAMITGLLVAGSATAQTYPNKPIRVILGFGPGGSIDLAARALGDHMSKELGQPLVFDNRPGAASSIGLEIVARAAPDGYTIGATSPVLTINPHLTQVPYDTLKDFAYVARITTLPSVVTVNDKLPVKTVKELIDYIKARPGQLNSGSGGATHRLSVALFDRVFGLNSVHVVYQTGAQFGTALGSGEVHYGVPDIGSATPTAKAGLLRMLAVLTPQRSQLAPELPSLEELGIRGVTRSEWIGLLAPAGTPPEPARRRTSWLG
jgi:tripartite-type tricarboxylate transporter receptor subunit TctC